MAQYTKLKYKTSETNHYYTNEWTVVAYKMNNNTRDILVSKSATNLILA